MTDQKLDEALYEIGDKTVTKDNYNAAKIYNLADTKSSKHKKWIPILATACSLVLVASLVLFSGFNSKSSGLEMAAETIVISSDMELYKNNIESKSISGTKDFNYVVSIPKIVSVEDNKVTISFSKTNRGNYYIIASSIIDNVNSLDASIYYENSDEYDAYVVTDDTDFTVDVYFNIDYEVINNLYQIEIYYGDESGLVAKLCETLRFNEK